MASGRASGRKNPTPAVPLNGNELVYTPVSTGTLEQSRWLVKNFGYA